MSPLHKAPSYPWEGLLLCFLQGDDKTLGWGTKDFIMDIGAIE